MKDKNKRQNGKKEHKEKSLKNADDEPPLSSRGSYQKRKPSVGIQQNAGDKDKKPLRVAIYSRVSTCQQGYGYSLTQQIDLCRKKCRDMGWQVRYIFKENGVSGKDTSRPQFQVMLQKARMGRFDILVVNQLDRFARSLYDAISVEQELKSYNVNLYSVQEMIDTTTEIGKFHFNTIISVSQLERHLIRQRSLMGMKGLAKSGRWPNNFPPLAYDKKDDGKLEINKKEAALVRRIFRLYLKLKAMSSVAFELNQMNEKTKRNNSWSPTAIKRVLDNKIYIGIYEVADIKEKFPEYRIIDEMIFDKAQKLRCRAKKVREAMPLERKKGVVSRIFDAYLAFLREEEQETIGVQEVSAI